MKKPSVVSLLITLMLAAVVCIQGEPVKDSKGNPVIAGQKYFIQPVKTKNNNGGGLVPASTNILPPYCPLVVTQTILPYQPGLPVNFTKVTRPQVESEPIETRPQVESEPIETSSDVNIEFNSDIWPICKEFSKLWEVEPSSSADKEPAIVIGGKAEDENTWFQIEKKDENTYKLTTSSGTVGAIPGAWFSAPRLVLTNDDAKTLIVKFKKVEDDVTTTSTSRVEKLGLRMFPFY